MARTAEGPALHGLRPGAAVRYSRSQPCGNLRGGARSKRGSIAVFCKVFVCHGIRVCTTRMTISLYGDDKTFEQIKKQLNRSVEVIKVLDFTELSIHKKEILYIKLHSLKKEEIEDIIRSASVFGVTVCDYDRTSLILESVKTEDENSDLLAYYKKYYASRMEAVRGGSVAIESVSRSDR